MKSRKKIVVTLFLSFLLMNFCEVQALDSQATSQSSTPSRSRIGQNQDYMVFANDFFKFSNGKLDGYKKLETINTYLKDKGYRLLSSEKGDYNSRIDKFEADGIKIEISSCGNDFQITITIQFKDSEQVNSFISNMKSSGWKKYPEGNYYYGKGYTQEDSFEISVNGTEVIIDYYPI